MRLDSSRRAMACDRACDSRPGTLQNAQQLLVRALYSLVLQFLPLLICDISCSAGLTINLSRCSRTKPCLALPIVSDGLEESRIATNESVLFPEDGGRDFSGRVPVTSGVRYGGGDGGGGLRKACEGYIEVCPTYLGGTDPSSRAEA